MKLGSLFFPPVFADEEQTRRGTLLHTVLWIIMLTVTIQLLLGFFVLPQNHLRWFSIMAVINGSHLFLMHINRSGHTGAASFGLVVVLWTVVTGAALTAGGIHAQAVTSYLVLVLIAGLLLGETAGVIVGAVCGATGLVLVLLEQEGHLPPAQIIHTSVSIWVMQVLYIGVVIGLQFLATRTINDALRQARQELKQRKRTEIALRESEQRYREVYENSSDSIFLLDVAPGGHFCYNRWNLACERVVGVSSSSVWGKSPDQVFSPTDAREMIHHFERCVTEGVPISYEESFTFSQGHFHFFTTLIPVRNTQGEIHRVVGVAHNITDRKQAEEKLRDSEARYRVVVEQTGQLVYDYDVASGRIVWRGAITKLTGFSVKEFQSVDIKTWEEMIHPEDRELAMASFHAAHQQTASYYAEYRFRCKDGGYIYVEDHGLFLPDACGKAVRMLGVMADITIRREAEEVLRRSRDELEAKVQERTEELQTVNRELNAFTYSVSHDLRAPLRAVNSFAELLHEDHKNELSVDGQELLQKIEVNGHRMEELITDLLKLSRLGSQTLVRSLVSMGELVDETIKEVRTMEKHRDVEIRVGELPDCEGDVSLLKQVWVNLISNAFKFSRRRPYAVVEIGCNQKGEEAIYFVRDNGEGFDPAKASRLFGVFQRLHSQNEFEGTGIGLSIVQRIVNRHGGRIWAEAAVGQGATFYFTLPQSVSPAANGMAESPEDQHTPSEVVTSGVSHPT